MLRSSNATLTDLSESSPTVLIYVVINSFVIILFKVWLDFLKQIEYIILRKIIFGLDSIVKNVLIFDKECQEEAMWLGKM
jgi:hypothetical protein